MFSKLYEKFKKFMVNNYKFLLSLIVIIFFCFYELPYVIYTPGGVIPLEERIEVDNDNSYDGSLNMSYVTMLKGRIPLVLMSFVAKNWDLEKTQDITLEGENVDDMLELDHLYMKQSVDNATILAYQKSGEKIEIKEKVNNVVYIAKEAKTDIKKYDQVLEVDGKEVQDVLDIKKLLQDKKEGDMVSILVNRDGKKIKTSGKLYDTEDGLKIGIVFLTTYKYDTDPKINVKIKKKEAGPSGGLMLSLAIYNSLVKEDITKGDNIVGTGTIDIDGHVGEIDGVKYKILGAEKNDADVFLCPMENYKEALKMKKKYKLKLAVKGVSTFDEAIEYLEGR